MDLKLKSATIVDGTGKRAFKGSIGISGDRITEIGDVSGEAEREIDCTGLTATPGFIDSHSHGDQSLLWYPEAQNFVMQGVTTIVASQCGMSPAPIGEQMPLPMILRGEISEVFPHKYEPENRLFSREVVNDWMKRRFGWTIDYRTMGEWFKEVEKKGISINILCNVGHGTCRYRVLGEDFDRPATSAEIDRMKEYVTEGLEDGCVGMSVGLDYDPGYFADEHELLELVGCIKRYGGIYNPHFRKNIRAKGVRAKAYNKALGYVEVIEHTRRTGTPLHVSHLCPTYDIPMMSRDTPEILLEAVGKASMIPLEKALQEGLDITFDTIMWPWPRRRVMPYLCSPLAPWIKELGNRDKLAEWLKVPDFREELKSALKDPRILEKWLPISLFKTPRWAEEVLVTKSKIREYEGKYISEISQESKKDPFEVYLDMIANDPDARGATELFFMPERIVREFLKHPLCSVSLDSYSIDNTYEEKSPPYSQAGGEMRQTFSGFPAFLETYVKNQKMFTIEEAVQKVCLPAKRWNALRDRGRIARGAFADIVLMDFPRLHVQEDDMEPRLYPEGIEHVIVNGELVVFAGKHTRKRSGKVLRRTKPQTT